MPKTKAPAYINQKLAPLVRDIDGLKEDPKNARRHPEHNLHAISASLGGFRQQKPIVVTKSGKVVAGNGALRQAKALGWKQIAAVVFDGSAQEATAYGIADNATAESAEWDDDVLAGLVQDMEPDMHALLGFDEDAMAWLLDDGTGGEGNTDPDAVPELPEKPISKLGDLWALGEHRLLCGDSTKREDVERVMGGEKINVAFTSPPYAEQRKEQYGGVPAEEYVDWFKAVADGVEEHLAVDGSFFINIKPHCHELERHLYVFDLVIAMRRRWGWMFAEEFCWERNGIPQRVIRRFKNQFEPVYQFARGEWKFNPEAVMHESDNVPIPLGPGGGDTNAARRQGKGNGGAIETGRAKEVGMAYPGNRLPTSGNAEALNHPAAFPVGLPSFFIRAYTDGEDIVYDPFCGSGTTIIACEQLDRQCRAIEIEPKYVDVAVKRWEEYTGKTAERAESDA